MSERSTRKRSSKPERPTRGRADLARLRGMSEPDIRRVAPTDLADLPEDFWDGGELVTPVSKKAISLRVDKDVLDWFKETGPRYQTRINAVLRAYVARTRTREAPLETKRRRGVAG